MNDCTGSICESHPCPAPRNGRGRRSVMAALCAALAISSTATSVMAQSSDVQRLVDELVRRQVEAELKNSRGVEKTATTRTTAQRATGRVTEQILQIREVATQLARDVQDLASVLNEEQRYVSGLQLLAGDALKLRARSTLLSDRSRLTTDIALITPDFEAFDRDWRVLAYRLRQVRSLSRQAVQYIDKIDQHDQRLGKLLTTTPQIDVRELYLRTASLTADVANLIDDIEIELENSTQKSQLLLQARKVQQQAQTMSFVVNSSPEYDRVKAEYDKLQQLWNPLAARLRVYDNRYLERNLQRINATVASIAEMLWIKQTINREQLLHLATNLTRDVDDFFLRAPLKLLIDLPNSQDVLPIADEFYGNFEHFIDCVQQGNSNEELVDAYRYIDDAWTRFEAVFRPIKSEKAQLVLNQIKSSVDALRAALMIQPDFDPSMAAQLAATLENLAEHLDVDMRRWHQRNSVPERDRMLRDSAAFLTASRTFHENVSRGADQQQLRQDCAKLLRDWDTVYNHVLVCQGDDHEYLRSLAQRTSPALIELQSLLGQR